MNRLPKKRGITQVEEDKSLILRQNLGNPPKVINDKKADQVQFLAVPIIPRILLRVRFS
jgi:hypothetical protein